MKIKGKELSEETIAEACEAYGINFEKKKKFKPIIVDSLTISVNYPHSGSSCPVKIVRTGDTTVFDIPEAKQIINAIQSVINYINETET